MTIKILAVSSEAFPLAKTGGLGDAVSGMMRALAHSDVSATLMLPAYRGIMRNMRDIRVAARLKSMPGGDATLLSCFCPALGLPMLLLQNDELYDRDGIYVDTNGNDYSDNATRFAALAHAATRVAAGATSAVPPDIVHAHDWHAALTPLLLRQARLKNVKSILTIHNLAFQGIFPMHMAESLGIGAAYCDNNGLEFWGKLNFLKAGIQFADIITVVSGQYAQEILTPKFGCGLEGLLAARSDALIAIPNGIDSEMWNPQHDIHLGAHCFGPNNLANKSLCKRDLQRCFGLDERRDATVMAMGSRLTTQKMADLAVQAFAEALHTHPTLQVAVLGQGEKRFEAELQTLANNYPGRCAVQIGYDEPRAHILHAGADILLHGSRFEPFGLAPLYAMRYGTVPIGSRVGGMVDTINDPGPDSRSATAQVATGILFEGETAQSMTSAIERAMSMHEQPLLWRTLQRNGMSVDFSWTKAVCAYERIYRSVAPSSALENPAASVLTAKAHNMAAPAQLPQFTKSRRELAKADMPPRKRNSERVLPNAPVAV